MHQSRLQQLTSLAFTLTLVSACTPQTPKKSQTNGECKVNADCASNLCVKNRCATEINCSDDGNQLLPKCQRIPCNEQTACPNKYYCGGAFCIYGDAPACNSDSDCEAPTKYCDRDEKNPAENQCVVCITEKHCPDGQGCKANKCVAAVKACVRDTDCSSTAATPVCSTKASNKICVECNVPKDCATHQGGVETDWSCTSTDRTCKDKTTIMCTTDAECSASKPICEGMTCAACDGFTDERCPAGKQCDRGAMSATKGQCVVPAGTGCQDNSACRNVPASSPPNSTQWCDQSDRTCKPCTTQEQCGAGTCSAGVCVPPNTDNACPNGPSDCADGEACNNGHCGSLCVIGDVEQCKAPKVCIRAEGQTTASCQAAATCTPGNNATCGGGTYNGLACIGGGFCRNCGSDDDCGSSPDNRTKCDTSSRLCVDATPPATLFPLGAVCAGDHECASGLCLEIGKAGGGTYARLCTSVCSRTETSGGTLKDCPTAPDTAGLAGHRTNGPNLPVLPALNPNVGFRCTVLNQAGAGTTSTRICLHGNDYKASRNDASATPANTYTIAGGMGQGAGTAASMCQADIKDVPTDDVASQTCAYRCGANEDCPATTGMACAERLATQPDGQTVSIGTVSCIPRVGKTPAGEFCYEADQCAERMCDGQCVSRRVVRIEAGQPKAPPCLAGDVEYEGLCYKRTERSKTCSTDGDCDGEDRCMSGKCYDVAALTGELCQDEKGCSDPDFPADQFCSGRCAKHCNASDSCSSEPKLVANDITVCGLRPSAPGDDGLSGTVWSRVCRAKSPGAGARNVGDACTEDLQCKTEICEGTAGNKKCAEMCGNASKCAAGKHCRVVYRRIDPTDAQSVQFSVPVCL